MRDDDLGGIRRRSEDEMATAKVGNKDAAESAAALPSAARIIARRSIGIMGPPPRSAGAVSMGGRVDASRLVSSR